MKAFLHAAVMKPVEVEAIMAMLLGGMIGAVAVFSIVFGYHRASEKHEERE